MAYFDDNPLVNTGNPTFDTTFTAFTICGLAYAVVNVSAAFTKAGWHNRERKRAGLERQKKANLFVILAAVSLGVVTWLRFQHIHLKLVSGDEIKSWLEESKNVITGDDVTWFNDPVKKVKQVVRSSIFEEVTSTASSAYEEATSNAPSVGEVVHVVEHVAASVVSGVGAGASVLGSALQTGGSAVMHEAEKDGEEIWTDAKDGIKHVGSFFGEQTRKVTRKGQKAALDAGQSAADETAAAAQHFGHTLLDQGWALWNGTSKIPRSLAKKFPWAGDYFYPKSSIWDLFKSLIDTGRRFWWTQQWVTGYLTWAIFVGLECHHRHDKPQLALSFAALGYCVSLAMAQSLFFAYIILHWFDDRKYAHNRRRSMLPQLAMLLIPALVELAVLWGITRQTARDDKASRLRWTNILQTFLVTVPAILAGVLTSRRGAYWSGWRSVGEAKLILTLVWWAISCFCFIGYVVGTVVAYRETSPTLPTDAKWWAGWGLLGVDRFIRRREHPAHVLHSAKSVLGALGDHDWLNAVGWDVLLSALTLSTWAAISSVSAHGILKCAAWPWLDVTLEFAQTAAGQVQGAAQPYIGDMKEDINNVQRAAQPYVESSKAVIDRESRGLQRMLKDAELEPSDVVKKARSNVASGASSLDKATRKYLAKAYEVLRGEKQDHEDPSEEEEEDEEEDDEDLSGGDDDDEESDGDDAAYDKQAIVLNAQRSMKKAQAIVGSTGPRLRLRGGGGTRKQNPYDDEDEDGEDWTEVHSRKKSRSPAKKRGRPSKAAKAEADEFDGERSGSRSRAGSQMPTPRSQSRAASQSRTRGGDRQTSPAKRRSSRIKGLTSGNLRAFDRDEDQRRKDSELAERLTRPLGQGKWGVSYVPREVGRVTGAVRQQLPSFSTGALPEVPLHAVADGAEAAGVSWVLFVLGGLGVLSAGVFGAEETRN